MKRRGMIVSYVLSQSRAAVYLADFLLNFWDHDNSPYIKEKQRKGQGLSRNYTVGQIRAVESYIAPFFNDRVLEEITRRDIEAFINFMAEKQDNSCLNRTLKAGLQQRDDRQ
jgi:hypothetical protein